jgi:hypothetical protein
MSQKKAQIKMFETIAVIIVFFFILIFGLVYYNSTQINAIKKMDEANKQLRSIEIMKIATYLPELQCSNNNVLKANCLDSIKIDKFSELSSENKPYYLNVLGYGSINVTQVYPITWGDKTEKTIYEMRKSNPKSRTVNYIPIVILDPVKRTYSAGYMEVEVVS